jgi:membrane associated rhomboid family serine protease
VILFAGIGDVLSAMLSGYASLGLSGFAAGLLIAAITQSIPGSRDQLKHFGETWLYTVFAVATWSVCLPNLYLMTDVSAQAYVGGTIGGLVASIGWTWWSRIRSRPEEYESLLLVNKL